MGKTSELVHWESVFLGPSVKGVLFVVDDRGMKAVLCRVQAESRCRY